ncbi:sigma-70 factor domain-containing protein, partial [Synechococcus sp. MIT S9509]
MASAIAAAPVATPLKAVPSKAAPSKASVGKPVAVRSAGADVDLVRSYLRDIGRVPLLSHQQEITLGRQVQELMDLEAQEAELSDQRGGETVPAAELAKAAGLSAAQLKRKL